MSLINSFDLLGRVSCSPTFELTKNHKKVCKYCIETKNTINDKLSYITIICFNELAEISALKCQYGATVQVSGEIVKNGKIIEFIATDMYIIKVAKKMRISEDRYHKLNKLYEP